MKRRDFFKTCAAGVAAGPIALIASSNAGYPMSMKYLTVPWKQLVDEVDDLVSKNHSGFSPYTKRTEAMKWSMTAHHKNARETGRMLRVTIPRKILQTDSLAVGQQYIPNAVKYMADRLDIIYDSGQITTIKDRETGAAYRVDGRAV